MWECELFNYVNVMCIYVDMVKWNWMLYFFYSDVIILGFFYLFVYEYYVDILINLVG